jgi:hypothetical protein
MTNQEFIEACLKVASRHQGYTPGQAGPSSR